MCTKDVSSEIDIIIKNQKIAINSLQSQVKLLDKENNQNKQIHATPVNTDNSELNNPDSHPDSEVIGQANAGGSNLKDYYGKVKEVTEDSQYVKLDLENGKPGVIKKSTYCWLLEEERGSVSSLRRFIGSSKDQSKTRSKQFKRNTIQNEKASKKRKIGRYSGHATTSDEEDDMDTSLDNSTASKIDRQDMAIDEDGYQNNAIKLHYITVKKTDNEIDSIPEMVVTALSQNLGMPSHPVLANCGMNNEEAKSNEKTKSKKETFSRSNEDIPDSDEERSFSNWFRTAEGIEFLKVFVVLNSIVVFSILAWPNVKESLNELYYIYVQYFN
ncbi:hypothetical protein FQR65_LT08498 [Abscondita terminalis]|nr:hypothetical protein FQR65_LT08498 [Abscondita terminalis]